MAVHHHDEQDEDENEDKHDILTTQNKLHISYICIAPSESLGAHLSSGVLVDLLVHSASVVLNMNIMMRTVFSEHICCEW